MPRLYDPSAALEALNTLSGIAARRRGSESEQKNEQQSSVHKGTTGDHVLKCAELAAAVVDARLDLWATERSMKAYWWTCWLQPDCNERVERLYGAQHDRDQEAVRDAEDALRNAGCLPWR